MKIITSQKNGQARTAPITPKKRVAAPPPALVKAHQKKTN